MKTILCCCVFSLVAISFAPALESDWKAGLSKVCITPQASIWMGGYAGRKTSSEKVLQDLYTKALAIEDPEGTKLVIVTLDLIGVPKSLRVDIEKYAVGKHDLKPGQLLLNASHTHSGPAIRLYRPNGGTGTPVIGYHNVPEKDQPARVAEVETYLKKLRGNIHQAIDESIGNLAPAELTWGRARCGFAMNRRTPVQTNTGVQGFKNSPFPDGPVDHDVPVLRIRDSKQKLQGVLFGYACHATTMGTMEIHGDWPGYAQQYFEEDHPDSIAMFLNGCSGDQNPYPRRLQPFLHRHGRSMATAIEAALETPQIKIQGKLRSEIAWPEIAYSKAPGKAELEKRIAEKTSYEKRYAEFLLDELSARGSLPQSYPVPVQVIRLGDQLTFAAIGGETTIDYSLRLKKELSAKSGGPVWVAGYSNDVMTYIPSERVRKEGGYEGGSAMIHIRSTAHPAPWAPGIEAALVGKIHELFDSL
ncbi:MAG: neutral/alkaline non-lysosomal ceramidase N-terminal domain-containing protein [Verrucomicrobiales bacterium]|nr:neutral/alkaline non-lysosomal ceramidase N-terminal domain-containing protein [Verrucomicrobiales bacterium]